MTEKIRRVSPYQYRYCFNFCAFSYTLAWWDWDQWQRMIDWMALHGINMPLAVTGQEAVWQNVYRQMGLTDEQLSDFFVGPGFLPFGWMGCLDGWGGPLPQSWIDSHAQLQQKIVARERELGMTPVLQGFTGHVPAALRERFPEAKFQQLPSWCEFPGTQFVDPSDPLFEQIGKAFIEEQTRLYGTDHLVCLRHIHRDVAAEQRSAVPGRHESGGVGCDAGGRSASRVGDAGLAVLQQSEVLAAAADQGAVRRGARRTHGRARSLLRGRARLEQDRGLSRQAVGLVHHSQLWRSRRPVRRLCHRSSTI